MTTTFVTTVTRSYVPLARVLMQSVQKFHPEARRVVVQMDGERETVLDAEVIRPSDLIPDPHELAVLTAMYSVYEFPNALKPSLLLRELASADQVVFLDPDTRLFQPMDVALAQLAAGPGVLLTPHQVAPPSAYRKWESYEWILSTVGVFNLGFLGVTQAGIPFLQWWGDRLRRDCLADPRKMHWADQRITGMALSYFDVGILRDPAYNVGWWNLEERSLTRQGDTWMVGDAPLVHMHYSGVRPALQRKSEGDAPYLICSENAAVADRPDEMKALRKIEADYVDDLMAAGYAELSKVPYGFNVTAGGRELSPRDRRRYREIVLGAESRGEIAPSPDELPKEPLSWKLRGVAGKARDTFHRITS